MGMPVQRGGYQGYLAQSEGLLFRERFYWSQVLCGACERKTQFKMAQWNSNMPDRIDDTLFQAQPAVAEIREESECCGRYCCHQFRELKLGLFPLFCDNASMDYPESGWPANAQPMLVMDKPFKCPVCCCCCMPFPFEMSVSSPEEGHLGKALYEFSCWTGCWPCDQHMTLLDASGQPAYKVHTPQCCGGCCGAPDGKSKCCVNCCAPSCFSSTHTAFVHDAVTGKQVGVYENQWPGCNVRGVCQADSGASNYILKFPPGASPQHKALIMTGLFLSNFLFFEQRANQK